MSLSSALTNAVSGLTASARAVQVASSNIANAMTEGYATRRLDLAASTLDGTGTGVRINGVTRQTDPILESLFREASGASEGDRARSDFWTNIHAAISSDTTGVSAALSGFEGKLISATARPDQTTRLTSAVNAAQELVQSFETVETNIQQARTNADAAIAKDIETLNKGLARVHALNNQILRLEASGASTLGLLDERDSTISSLSEIVPLKEHRKSDGRVALFTANGLQLLDLKPQELSFTKSAGVTAQMQIGAGLSGIEIGNRSIDTRETGVLGGGRLAAMFSIRDQDSVQAQTQLDALALDIVTRFSGPTADPTLASGEHGLFTFASSTPGSTGTGLAGQLELNQAVQIDQGGSVTKLRDGIGSLTQGPVGNTSQLNRLIDALHSPLVPPLGSDPQTAFTAIESTESTMGVRADEFQSTSTASNARKFELEQQRIENGVDTDAEMQRLLTLERSYAANARLIQTADSMIQRLLEI